MVRLKCATNEVYPSRTNLLGKGLGPCNTEPHPQPLSIDTVFVKHALAKVDILLDHTMLIHIHSHSLAACIYNLLHGLRCLGCINMGLGPCDADPHLQLPSCCMHSLSHGLKCLCHIWPRAIQFSFSHLQPQSTVQSPESSFYTLTRFMT